MGKVFAAIVVALIVAVLVFAATKPDTFRAQRASSVNAPPEQIFALINDLHRWRAWSPHEKKHPAMKRTLTGAPQGEGAVYEWEGNKDIGKGRMEITDSSPPSRVRIKLDFVRPFEAHNTVEFTLEPNGDSTIVTWAMHGPSPFLAKLVSVFFGMDSMIGKDFEAGLANPKAVAES